MLKKRKEKKCLKEEDDDAAAVDGFDGTREDVGRDRLEVLQHEHPVRVTCHTQSVTSASICRMTRHKHARS